MLRFIDIVIVFIETVVFFFSAIFILEGLDQPILMLPLFALYLIVHYSIKRNKKLLKYVKGDFKKMGYELISERPASLSESRVSVEPTIFVNNIALSRFGYIRKFARVFKAKNREGEIIELNTELTKMWDGENRIVIKNEEDFD